MEHLKHKVVKLVRKIEHLLKIDVYYVLHGGFWTSVRFVVSTGASLVSMIAFGNLLSREAYGTYNYLLSLGASLSFLTLSGAGIAVTRAVARGHEHIVPRALKLQLQYNVIAVSTVLAAAAYYGTKGNILFASSLVFLALAYPLAEAFHIYEQVLMGRKRFDTLTHITNVVSILSTATTVTTLLVTKSVLALVVVYSIMSLVPNVIAYFFIVKPKKQSDENPEQVAEMQRTAFHITGAGLIGTAAAYIDKLLLFQVAGPAALAVYGFALAGPDRLKSLIKNWLSISLPQLAQRTLPEIRLFVYKRLGLLLLLGTVLSLVYIICAPILFKLFLPRYLDAILYSQVQALTLIIVPVTVYFGSIFAAQNMLKATYALGIGSYTVKIILFVIMGWLWHTWGLVIASLLTNLVNAIYSIIIWEWEVRRLLKQYE